jgi:hypothetical protein
MVNDPNQGNSNNTNNPGYSTSFPDELQQLLASFDQLHPIKDPIHIEYELLQAAKRYDLPLDCVRQMFKDYRRQRQDEIWGRSRLLLLLCRIERNMEWLNQSMSRMDLFPVLEHLSKLSIIVALIAFVGEIPERAEQRATEQKRTNYEAWRIILASEGKPPSAGRVEALEDLNKQKIPLANTNLSGAFLSDIKLPEARLDGAKLNGAVLNRANLQNAVLINANLEKAALIDANLEKAALIDANLKYANLLRANLTQAVLSEADLTQADLEDANLEQADLTQAKGLTVIQLKESKNWQSACYDPDLREQLGLSSLAKPKC